MMAKEAMAAKRTPAARDALAHRALLYQHEAEYVDAIASFLVAGLAEGQPAFVAIPEARAGPLRAGLGADAGRVRFADMADMGRNPAWIIPRILDFADEHQERSIRYVGEPIWPARSAAQIRESTRHEALINLALARTAAAVLCPYDASRLDPAIIADARINHPLVMEDGGTKPSPAYSPAFRYPLSCDSQLPSPTVPSVMSYTFTTDLSSVRDLVRRSAREAGLSEPRAVDLVLAVSEIAANTVRHAKSPGELEIWHDKDEIVCQIQDKGTIADPLAGRRRPSADAMGGHGLWLVNQVCDLVEIRSDDSGTTVRLHMSLRGR